MTLLPEFERPPVVEVAASLHEIIPHLHLEHGVDAREGVDHPADQGGVAKSPKAQITDAAVTMRKADQ